MGPSPPRLTRHYLALPNGIPSRDCIRRLLLALKPQAFQRCFQAWITQALVDDDATGKRLVAIDGKTCRRSQDAGKELGSLHVVSAWASEEGIALGQVATDRSALLYQHARPERQAVRGGGARPLGG